jgi:hypothetical protein
VVPVVAAGGVPYMVPEQLSGMTVVGTTVAGLTMVVLAAVVGRATAGWAVLLRDLLPDHPHRALLRRGVVLLRHTCILPREK